MPKRVGRLQQDVGDLFFGVTTDFVNFIFFMTQPAILNFTVRDVSIVCSNTIIAELDARGAKVVISQHPRRTKHLVIDEAMYKWRHLIETSSARSRSANAFAMHADKTDQRFTSMIHLTAALINSR
jgi:hypothetical protein